MQDPLLNEEPPDYEHCMECGTPVRIGETICRDCINQYYEDKEYEEWRDENLSS